MELGLEGMVAIVTGGASGIGAECVRTLVGEGCQVAIADIEHERAKRFAAEFDGSVTAFSVDVRSALKTTEMVQSVKQRHGRLDLAINSAGIVAAERHSIHETGVEEWRRIIEVDLEGVYTCLRAELTAMVPGPGAIVNIASVMSNVASEGSSAYVSAKHGVSGLTKAAALEYAAFGIRINAVGPGFVDTPLLDHWSKERRYVIESRHPLGRLGRPEEIARVAVFLLSPAASFVTGSLIAVDGGYLAQ